MQGVRTPIALKEKALALYATERSFSEVSRQLKLAPATVFQLVKNDTNFEEFRTQVEQEYIVKAWGSIEKAHDVLIQQLENPESVASMTARDLSDIISKLHKTVTNVAQHVQMLQVNIQTDTSEDIEAAAYDFIGKQCGLKTSEIKRRLGIELA